MCICMGSPELGILLLGSHHKGSSILGTSLGFPESWKLAKGVAYAFSGKKGTYATSCEL